MEAVSDFERTLEQADSCRVPLVTVAGHKARSNDARGPAPYVRWLMRI